MTATEGAAGSAADGIDVAELASWRALVDAFMEDSRIHRRTTSIQMESMSRELAENTAITTDMHSGLAEVIPVIRDLAGVVRTIRRVGRILKPFIYFASLIFAVVVYLKTGRWEMP